MAAYRAPVARAAAEIREKGSVFLARLAPAATEDDARAFLAEVAREHPDATHHCWAWRLGPLPLERSSDAGEPGGTAGVPMLQVLRGAGLADVVAVVVRWYGGTNLGKGGLARAYAGAVRAAVADITIELRVPTVTLTLEVPYEKIGAVKRLIHPPKVELRSESYGAAAWLVLTVWETETATLEAALGDLAIAPTRPGRDTGRAVVLGRPW